MKKQVITQLIIKRQALADRLDYISKAIAAITIATFAAILGINKGFTASLWWFSLPFVVWVLVCEVRVRTVIKAKELQDFYDRHVAKRKSKNP